MDNAQKVCYFNTVVIRPRGSTIASNIQFVYIYLLLNNYNLNEFFVIYD
jgi:hypothetical protein